MAITDEGVFIATDDTGKNSYYWRGAVTNNYIKFANKWWRIIRINGDGTIRIIYDGTEYHANGTSTTDSIVVASTAFNTNDNDNAYVGFMYGKTGASTYEAAHANTKKSTILQALETWYTANLASYASKIDTNAGFCNDRSINTGSTTWLSVDTKKGYGTNATAYGAHERTLEESGMVWLRPERPTLWCKNESDLFTVSEAKKGNKALTYPIGLITVDEAIYAGGLSGADNSSYYLFNGQDYWTLTPVGYSAFRVWSFYVTVAGSPITANGSSEFGVRPVINLKADVTITGSGTQNNPYVVS
ncbi:MAG: hypothetical protein K2J20_04970 [Bacilli bacterium]|nr:hypothetical protein [Bacilli bacterium]